MKDYDAQLNMQYITREYAPSSINVIRTFSEIFICFQIGNQRFLDSLQISTAALDVLVKNLESDRQDTLNHLLRH